MKQISIVFSLLFAISWLSVPSALRAQTLTINSVSGTQFCAGDPVSITFTATGTWLHKNAFTFQLSDAGGSFLTPNFRNIGSLIDTLPGTFTIVSAIPPDALASGNYRFRVMAANPYTVSADNGTDVNIAESPGQLYIHSPCGNAGLVNSQIQFDMSNGLKQDAVIYWDFGANSNPSSTITHWDLFGPTTMYSAAGQKTVTVRAVAPGGCSVSDIFHINVFDCTDPIIPYYANIASADQDLNKWANRSVWVNPGVSVSGGIFDTIFAEAGATVTGGSCNVVYLKPGAMYASSGSYVIYADGASVSTDATKLACPSLTFDYSNAPPNSIMHINDAAVSVLPLVPIQVTPNPTKGFVALQGVPANANMSVMNILGETIRTLKAPDATVDLSMLPAGTYYIRIASIQGVVTKKLVKE